MRVAHINCVYEYGSTGRLIKEIVDEGCKCGIESRVFYSEKNVSDERAVRYISDIERNVHAVLSRLTGLQGYWSSVPTRRLLKEIKKFQPDVVHIHTLHGNGTNFPILFKFLQEERYPVILTLHDCWWFTGRCAHPLSYACDKWEKESEKKCTFCPASCDVCPSWFIDRASQMLEDKRKWFEKLPNLHVVCVSKWMEEQVRKSYVFSDASRVSCIYNWIDLEIFHEMEKTYFSFELPQSKKIVLGVASIWGENKGVADFIWLSQNLPNEYQVVLVGNMSSDVTLPENIIHIPGTNSKYELASLYNRADVFVNPSKFESFGLTTAEAMACGTPVVVYEFSTSREVVGENCGEIVPINDKKGLLTAIIEIGNLPKENFECAEWVRRQFGKDKGLVKYFDIYKSITENK